MYTSCAHGLTTMVLLVGLAGCPRVKSVKDVIERLSPKVSFNNLDLQEMDYDGVEVLLMFDLDQPVPDDVALDAADYAVDVDGIEVFQRSLAAAQILRPSPTAVAVPARIPYDVLYDKIGKRRGQDEVDVAVKGNFRFDTPEGPEESVFDAVAKLPLLRPPSLSFAGFRSAELDLATGRVDMVLLVEVAYPDGAQPITIERFAYDLRVDGVLVASAAASGMPAIPGGGKQTASLPVSVALVEVGEAVVKAITDGGSLAVELGADLTIGTPWGEVGLRVDEAGDVRVETR